MAALALVVLGCASVRGGATDGAAREARPDSIVVTLVNDNYYAARVYAVWLGGQRRPFGTIAGNGGDTRMALAWEPRALTFEVFLVTEGSAYVSHSVDVAPGDSIEVRVPSNISESGFFRRVRR